METRMPVREIMTKGVITAETDMKVSDAGRKMLTRNIGTLIITEKGKPVGVVTERDMVRKIIAKDLRPSSATLKDLMTQPLVTVSPDDSIDKAARKMAELNIRRLPVIEDDKLIGIVTDTDMIAVSSGLADILSNLIEMNRENIPFRPGKGFEQGICERCETLSDSLEMVDGILVCESCKDETSR
ncbi:MAG: CBS domain-containing protein [Methanosarcinales archaeon]|nr:MAG: CBS domain-containing protein [Methanosarcinales archaeon]